MNHIASTTNLLIYSPDSSIVLRRFVCWHVSWCRNLHSPKQDKTRPYTESLKGVQQHFKNNKCNFLIRHLMYSNELQVKDTTYIQTSVSYLDIYIEIDSRWILKTKLQKKRDDITFPIVNFPLISSNIPATTTYGVSISQLIH